MTVYLRVNWRWWCRFFCVSFKFVIPKWFVYTLNRTLQNCACFSKLCFKMNLTWFDPTAKELCAPSPGRGTWTQRGLQLPREAAPEPQTERRERASGCRSAEHPAVCDSLRVVGYYHSTPPPRVSPGRWNPRFKPCHSGPRKHDGGLWRLRERFTPVQVRGVESRFPPQCARRTVGRPPVLSCTITLLIRGAVSFICVMHVGLNFIWIGDEWWTTVEQFVCLIASLRIFTDPTSGQSSPQ